ncbi:MAG: dockerin type I repeat-containing protein [Ruminococcus sp.]|nr:dockerin type I repeat-containing protein [Ruminococcus sp.]
MNGDGVFCTVKGTVAAGATGDIPLEVVPASRDTYTGSQVPNEVISVGYFKNKDVVRYGVKTNNGTISVGGGAGTTTTATTGGNDKPVGGLKGDANLDGKVSLADAVLIMQALSNPDDYKLNEQASLNADTNSDGGVSPSDALEIQLHDLGLPSALDS